MYDCWGGKSNENGRFPIWVGDLKGDISLSALLGIRRVRPASPANDSGMKEILKLTLSIQKKWNMERLVNCGNRSESGHDLAVWREERNKNNTE